ncbi:multidrug effflux MFS transporter [Ornithinimicrobium sp. W1665]|uniref:multidrug effflux MFS transporter n=1 Tax=unclassified Ornithinimicrobium TaxID=2615080 RepID=UPI003CE9B561
MSSAPVAAPPASLRPRTEPSPLGRLLLFGALVAIGPLTIDMYLAAFPAVVDDLSTTEATVQLTLTATLVGLATGQLLIGALSDSFGRRRPLIASLILYVLVSAAIAVSSSIEVLLLLRFVQGLAGAAGMVLSQAMVRDLYSGSRMATFISRLFLVVGVAPILAPTLGAQFLIFGSWRTIFWALGAFGLLLAVLALVFVKETLPPERRRHFGPRTLWTSYRVLLSDRRYVGLVLTACTAMGCLFAYISSATFVFQGLYGMTTQQYALVFAAGAGALTVTSQVNGSLVRTVHPAAVLRVALPSMLAIALALLTAALVDVGVWAIVGGIVLLMGSVGFVMPNSPSIALADHGERAGAAAALLGAANFVFGALISPVSGLFGVDSAVPMAAIMVVCAAASWFFYTVLARPQDILRNMPWE